MPATQYATGASMLQECMFWQEAVEVLASEKVAVEATQEDWMASQDGEHAEVKAAVRETEDAAVGAEVSMEIKVHCCMEETAKLTALEEEMVGTVVVAVAAVLELQAGPVAVAAASFSRVYSVPRKLGLIMAVVD
jgi:hypothetical protein